MDWSEFYKTKIEPPVGDERKAFDQFIRGIWVTHEIWNKVEKLEKKNKELENRLTKLEDFVVSKLHDRIE